ncbi:MAG: hypothetical protein FRX49_12781 [Trebouxia sp. A1-2]|nr:MAG: hypothetical protein FRX49_12781 [Trebouxia sp. A1-2]
MVKATNLELGERSLQLLIQALDLLLQVVDLALSSLSPLKKLLALLLHTCHSSPSTKHTHSLVCRREAQTCSQSETLHFAKSAHHVPREQSGKKKAGGILSPGYLLLQAANLLLQAARDTAVRRDELTSSTFISTPDSRISGQPASGQHPVSKYALGTQLKQQSALNPLAPSQYMHMSDS